MDHDHICFLYCSFLASDANPSCVADIVKTARQFNAAHDITGILVFDGERFCQYIEGPKNHLQDLIYRISEDERHIDFKPKMHMPLTLHRRFAHWSMGYVDIEGDASLATIQELDSLDGESALVKLQTLVPMLDTV